MGKKILLIDDETELVEMVCTRLEANGYQVIVAFNGSEGLARAEAEEPNLILLDIAMPGMDGLEVLRRLKYNTETRDIPVVMLTGKGESQSLFRAQDLMAVEYIIKPFDSQELLSVVKRYIY
jgi:DNA-binding response OmpR family regulator